MLKVHWTDTKRVDARHDFLAPVGSHAVNGEPPYDMLGEEGSMSVINQVSHCCVSSNDVLSRMSPLMPLTSTETIAKMKKCVSFRHT